MCATAHEGSEEAQSPFDLMRLELHQTAERIRLYHMSSVDVQEGPVANHAADSTRPREMVIAYLQGTLTQDAVVEYDESRSCAPLARSPTVTSQTDQTNEKQLALADQAVLLVESYLYEHYPQAIRFDHTTKDEHSQYPSSRRPRATTSTISI